MITSCFFDVKGNNYKRNIVIFSINSASVLSFRLFALSLNKTGGTWKWKTKTVYFVLSFRSFALTLHKIGCTRQFVSELTLHSFALSLQNT